MSTVIIPGRAVKGSRPTGNFLLNADSPQAIGLAAWYPMSPLLFSTAIATPQLSVASGVTRVIPSGVMNGYVANFNGTSGTLERPAGTQSITGPPFSVVAWVKPTAISSQQVFWSVTDPVTFQGWYFYVQSSLISFQAYNGAAATASAAVAPVAGAWSHIAAVESATNARACYINGGNPGTNTTSTAVTIVGSRAKETLGAFANGTQSQLGGQIAEVRVYNRALSDNEIWESYDPATRWDLYWQPSRRLYIQVPATTTRHQWMPLLGVN